MRDELPPPPLMPSSDPESSASETSKTTSGKAKDRRSQSLDETGKRRGRKQWRSRDRSRSSRRSRSKPKVKSPKSVSSSVDLVPLEEVRKLVLTIQSGCCRPCCSCAHVSRQRFDQDQSMMSGISEMAQRVRKGDAMKFAPMKSGRMGDVDYYEDTMMLVRDRDEKWSESKQPRGWSGFLIGKVAEYAVIAGFTAVLIMMLKKGSAETLSNM